MEKKITEIFINGKDTVAMHNVDQLERHSGSAFHGILVSAGRTEAAVTAERDKFKLPQWGQPNMAPPKEGSPQFNILSIFSISVFLG